MILNYRKKPVVIQAIQWDGSLHGGELIAEAFGVAVQVHAEKDDPRPPRLVCATLEGLLSATPGDWIIRGVKGEVYPCKPDVFAATYEPVDQEPVPDRCCYVGLDGAQCAGDNLFGGFCAAHDEEIHAAGGDNSPEGSVIIQRSKLSDSLQEQE